MVDKIISETKESNNFEKLSTTFKTGILSGEGAIREFAAYYLDFNKNNMNMFISRDDIKNNLGWITHKFLMDNITNESNKNNGRNLNLNKKIKSGKIDDNYYYNWNDDSNYEKTSNKKHNYIAKKYGFTNLCKTF